jgi:pimeloyl-ACP methyl ester carboxylesterase
MKKLMIIGAIILLAGVALLLVGPLLIPIPPLQGALPPQDLADPDSQFIQLDGIDVHYKTGGSGEPALILMHGFGSSLFTWRDVLGPLSQDRRVVAYDRPAFGLTERPLEWEGENPYSAESQAQMVIELMDRLGIQEAVLVGNSAGGSLAMLTALTFPERVQGLVLVSPAVYQGGGSPKWARWLLNTPQMERVGPLFTRQIRDWGREFAESAWHDPARITDEIWAGYTQPLQAQDWDRGLWNLTAASRDLDLDQALDRLDLPVLVVAGEDDRIVPTAHSVRLAGELPQAELAVLDNCGHVPQEECPAAFLETVNDFLDRIHTGSD